MAGADNNCNALIKLSAKAQFGDYQANGIMATAKKIGIHLRTLTVQVQKHLDIDDIADKMDFSLNSDKLKPLR